MMLSRIAKAVVAPHTDTGMQASMPMTVGEAYVPIPKQSQQIALTPRLSWACLEFCVKQP